jgi:hypothetical protein
MSWSDLTERLESDLQSRQESGPSGVRGKAAWEEAERLLRAHGGILLATHPSLHRDEMDDVIQETLLKLRSVETMRRLRAAGSPAGYVTVMLRNAVTDRLRKRFREQGRSRNSWTILPYSHMSSGRRKRKKRQPVCAKPFGTSAVQTGNCCKCVFGGTWKSAKLPRRWNSPIQPQQFGCSGSYVGSGRKSIEA